MSSSVNRILEELRRLQESAPDKWDRDLKKWREMTADGAKPSPGFDRYNAQRGYPGDPQLTKLGSDDEVNLLHQIAVSTCAKIPGVLASLNRYFEGGLLLNVVLTSEGYLGSSKLQQVTTAITVACRQVVPRSIVDIFSQTGPDLQDMGHRGKAILRIRAHQGGSVI
jgi:hypothetical protein